MGLSKLKKMVIMFYDFKNKFIYFIYFWLRWVFLAMCGLSLVAANGGYSSLQCVGFSLRWLLLLWSTGFSSCGSWALESRLSSCGAWAQLLCGMWDLPGPGLKPMCPALAGRFLTTVPPGKPHFTIFKFETLLFFFFLSFVSPNLGKFVFLS